MRRTSGKIKWYDLKKKYGFITPHDGAKDIFFHVSGLDEQQCGPGAENELQPGKEVTFDIFQTVKGQKAQDVAFI